MPFFSYFNFVLEVWGCPYIMTYTAMVGVCREDFGRRILGRILGVFAGRICEVFGRLYDRNFGRILGEFGRFVCREVRFEYFGRTKIFKTQYFF